MRKLIALCVFLKMTLAPAVALGQGAFQAIHGASSEGYRDFIAGLDGKGLMPAFFAASDDRGTPIFSAVAVENTGRHAWQARHNLDDKRFQEAFDEWVGKGYRIICFAAYRQGDATRYGAIWVKDGSKVAWQSRSGLTSREYQNTFEKLTGDGFRPMQVVGYPWGGEHRIGCIFVKDDVKDWAARHDMTEKEYQETFDTWVPKGFLPTSVSAYPTSGGTRFAAVFSKNTGGMAWSARHNLTADGYQTYFNEEVKKGRRPTHVVSYPWADGTRYLAVFVQSAKPKPAEPLPMSGTRVPELDAFDEAMQDFMRARHIQAGALAVSRDGKLLLSRGYGWSDRARRNLLGPDALFRLASVSKPITLALLWKLILEGKLKTTDKIVALLLLKPLPGQTMDERWRDITIEHLMRHEGGWDRDKAFDPMFRPIEIATALDRAAPANSSDVIQYMVGQPLQFNPGSKSVYSNFGYCILGRVIEKVSGKSYVECLQAEILTPLGLKHITLGRSLPEHRDPLEPAYLDSGRARNVFSRKLELVPAPDGSFHLEAMDAHGGLIAAAPDVVRFLNAYWIDGKPRKDEKKSHAFFGSLPGTWTVALQRPDGVNMTALFNQRSDASGLSYYAIREALHSAADKIKSSP